MKYRRIRIGIGTPSNHSNPYFISSSVSKQPLLNNRGFYRDRSLVVSPAAKSSPGVAPGNDMKRSMPISPSTHLLERASQRNGEKEVGEERLRLKIIPSREAGANRSR